MDLQKKKKKTICITSNTKDYIKVHHPKHCQNLTKLSTQKLFFPKILAIAFEKIK